VTQAGHGTQESRQYLSYLLRLWKAGDAGPEMWRASLESVQTRERVSFARLSELCRFLHEQTLIHCTTADERMAEE
jgi:hypothetical protein